MVEFFKNPEVTLVFIDAVLIYLFYCLHTTFYSKKNWFKERKWATALVYVFMFIAYASLNLLEIVTLNMAVTLASYFLPLFIIYKVDNIRGIVYYAFFMAIMISLETAEAFLMGTLEQVEGNKTCIEDMSPVALMVLALLEFIAIKAICYFGSKEKGRYIDKASIPFMIAPVFTVVILMVDTIRVTNSDYLNVNQFTEMAVILTVLNILFFIILEKYTYSIKKEMELKQSELQLKSDADIMEIATNNMRERLATSEEIMQQDRAMRHDRRHFEALLMSLLESEKYEEARQCLSERLSQEPHAMKRYCENTTVNAAITHYVSMAEKQRIKVNVATNIPFKVYVDEMQLAITISNLLENAIHACEKVPEEERFIELTAKYKRQLLLKITNSCDKKVELDEDGHPFSTAQDHGVGTRSVLAFVNQTGSEIRYVAEDKVFKVRMIIG